MNDDLRYPIGRASIPSDVTPDLRRQWMEDVAQAPVNLRRAVEGLTPEQLDTPYREGGWTVRQVVHHLADAQLNAYIRFRQGLVADQPPTIMPFDEEPWANLADARTAPPEISLQILEGVHDRWHRLLTNLTPDAFQRTVRHPQAGEMTLDRVLGIYSWHARHHTAHILGLRRRMGW